MPISVRESIVILEWTPRAALPWKLKVNVKRGREFMGFAWYILIVFSI